jgi:hypothetical protein
MPETANGVMQCKLNNAKLRERPTFEQVYPDWQTLETNAIFDLAGF